MVIAQVGSGTRDQSSGGIDQLARFVAVTLVAIGTEAALHRCNGKQLRRHQGNNFDGGHLGNAKYLLFVAVDF